MIEYPDDWQERRQKVISRDGHTCQKCGQPPESKIHVHHRTPIDDGGGHEISNLEVVCPDCHADEHGSQLCALCHLFSDNHLTEYKQGGTAGQLGVCDNHHSALRAKQRGLPRESDACLFCFTPTSGQYRLVESYDHPAKAEDADEPVSGALCLDCRRVILEAQAGEQNAKVRLRNQLPECGVA